ncbi:MAG: signal recognition particle-docking protein FtsY [Verrucomicrobia bacterium]|nr:signal recognition particle-docking protein FtsY [Verrucomicrobiota bacterium]
MGLFEKFRKGLHQTQNRIFSGFKKLVTGSPKLTADSIEELEAALLGADFGMQMTMRIIGAVRDEYEKQGGNGNAIAQIAAREVEKRFAREESLLKSAESGTTVITLVGVNGTGKTTTAAKLARILQSNNKTSALAACDTFRAAAIEQIQLWGTRLDIPVIAGKYGTDPAAVAHDAVSAAVSRGIDYLIIDTAGRLHTKSNLMQELQKINRVAGKRLPGAPHETLLVLDATTGMNALNQAREFNKAVQLSGLIITKLDGTSKGGMVVGIRNELDIPVKFIGVGEQPDDLQPFVAHTFTEALFSIGEEE